MVNSIGIKWRRRKNMVLSTGHPSDLKSFQVLGLSTRVSHAATVRVHTKKYLCAERCGESLREFGRRSGLSVMFEDIGVKVRETKFTTPRAMSSISLSVDTPPIFGIWYLVILSALTYLTLLVTLLLLSLPFPRLLWPTIIFRRLHYCPRQRPRSILELEIRLRLGSAHRRFSPGATRHFPNLTPISAQLQYMPYQEERRATPRIPALFVHIPPFSVCQQDSFEMRYNRRATQHREILSA